MNKLEEKIVEIDAAIESVREIDPGIHQILLDGFGCSLNLITKIGEKGDNPVVDLGEQIQMVSQALGFDLAQLVEYILQKNMGVQEESTKQADAETLEFITSDLDDYEKFLAANKAKESLDFLKNQI
jgi:hypothetical protein